MNVITSELNITRIKKWEAEDQIQQQNSRILDNKCPENIEILRGEYDLEDELKCVS